MPETPRQSVVGPNPFDEAVAATPLNRDSETRDLLTEHSRIAALSMLLLAGLVAYASYHTGVRKGLPTVALDWSFGLDVIRAAVVFAIFTAFAIFIIRGWAGLWPNQISTSGVGFPDGVSDGASEIEQGTREAIRVLQEIARSQGEH